VITCNALYAGRLCHLLGRYRLRLEVIAPAGPIPGSYWGAPEAGLIGTTVFARADTPLHSALHETAHVICMDAERRARLHTDAGGEHAEEDGVCYLQIVLARRLGVGTLEICADMDTWGYTFRLGSAYAWFTHDAEDTRAWLLRHGILTEADEPTWNCRDTNRFGESLSDLRAAGTRTPRVPATLESPQSRTSFLTSATARRSAC
jgi:hypothetical protein